MKTKLSLKILAIIVLPILMAACSNKESPLSRMLTRPANGQDTKVTPPDKSTWKKNDEPEEKPKEDVAKDKKDSDVPARDEVISLPLPPPPDDDFVSPPVFLTFTACGNNIVTQEILEDGIIRGEECEDGNASNGDGCSATCRKEFCGNGFVERGEQCDPGQKPTTPPTFPPVWNQAIPTESCDRYCDYIICGDGIVNGHEECDDCNQLNCDGCSSTCQLENLKEECNFTCSPSNPFNCPTRPANVCRSFNTSASPQ